MIKGIPIPAALPVLVVTWQSDPQGAGAHISAKLTLAGVILGGIEPSGVAGEQPRCEHVSLWNLPWNRSLQQGLC